MKILCAFLFLLTGQLDAKILWACTYVFYFGGSDCPHSTDPQNIANINAMRSKLPKVYPSTAFKFILVVMDSNLQDGIKFAANYPNWDELSIGNFYNNELMLAHVNQSAIPGVPHIMVYTDSLVIGRLGIPSIRKRTLLVDLVGESAIQKWTQRNYPMIK